MPREWLDQRVAHLKEKPRVIPYVQSYLARRRRFDGQIGAREIRQAKATILQQSEAEILRMALLCLAGTVPPEEDEEPGGDDPSRRYMGASASGRSWGSPEIAGAGYEACSGDAVRAVGGRV